MNSTMLPSTVQNSTFRFEFGNASVRNNIEFVNMENGVDVTFPMVSFELNASQPFYATPTRYFPLKVSANDSEAVLGRSFMQEASVLTHLTCFT